MKFPLSACVERMERRGGRLKKVERQKGLKTLKDLTTIFSLGWVLVCCEEEKRECGWTEEFHIR